MHHYEYDRHGDENDQGDHCKEVDEVDHNENDDNSRKCDCQSGCNNACEFFRKLDHEDVDEDDCKNDGCATTKIKASYEHTPQTTWALCASSWHAQWHK